MLRPLKIKENLGRKDRLDLFALNVPTDFAIVALPIGKILRTLLTSRSNLPKLRFEFSSSATKKPITFAIGQFFFINLGRKDSNLRDAWTKTRCLTTWRRPIALLNYNRISSLNVKSNQYITMFLHRQLKLEYFRCRVKNIEVDASPCPHHRENINNGM